MAASSHAAYGAGSHPIPITLNSNTLPVYAGYLTGATALGLGLTATLAPCLMGDFFGLPIPSISPETHKPYIQAKGVRDLSMGLMYFVLLNQGIASRRVIGSLICCHSLVGLGDAIVTWRKGVRGMVWIHVVGTAIAGAMGAKVLGFF